MREIDGQIEKVGCWSSVGILVLIWNVNTMTGNHKIFRHIWRFSSYPGQQRPLTTVAGPPEVRCAPLSVAVDVVAAPLLAAELLVLLLAPGQALQGRGGCRDCWGSLSCPAAPRCWLPAQPPWAGPSCTRPAARKCRQNLVVFHFSMSHWPFCSWWYESESHRPYRLPPRARKWQIQSRDASWFVGPLTWRLHQPCLQHGVISNNHNIICCTQILMSNSHQYWIKINSLASLSWFKTTYFVCKDCSYFSRSCKCKCIISYGPGYGLCSGSSGALMIDSIPAQPPLALSWYIRKLFLPTNPSFIITRDITIKGGLFSFQRL